MKYEIMLQILFNLLSRDNVSASYLASRHEISQRTVYRYIECLQLAGVPVMTKRGKGGGFTIPSSYKLPAYLLTKEELAFVINSLKALQKEINAPQITSALDKISSIAKNQYNGMNFSAGNVIIDGSAWGDTVSYRNKIGIIEKCIDENLKLLINYHDRGGDITRRTIEPHALVFKQGFWYVFAFCNLRNQFRLFKTGRIEYAHITGETFQRKPYGEEDLPLTFNYRDGELIDVDFAVEKSALPEVEEWLGIENVKTKRDGAITAHASLPNDKGLIPKILSFGKGIKVLAPDSLKENLKKAAAEIAGIY